MDHAVLQSLDPVCGMTCHRPCASPGTVKCFKAHCTCDLKTVLFCLAYGTWFGAFVTV